MSIKKYFLIFLCCSSSVISPFFHTQSYVTIVLEPAGDAKYTGREIGDNFERAITLQLAEHIKKNIEKKSNTIRVFLSRIPGQIVEPLQNAHFANRLGVDLYISIHCFEEREEKQSLFLYYLLYNPITDFWNSAQHDLQFIPIDQIHKKHLTMTQTYSIQFYEFLKRSYNNHFMIYKPIGIPFKPLIGLNCPAFALELSISSHYNWLIYAEPIAEGLLLLAKDIAS